MFKDYKDRGGAFVRAVQSLDPDAKKPEDASMIRRFHPHGDSRAFLSFNPSVARHPRGPHRSVLSRGWSSRSAGRVVVMVLQRGARSKRPFR